MTHIEDLGLVRRSDENVHKPNVFTPGSLPPWVKPTEAQLFPELTMAIEEALEGARQKKKNPNRIGAGIPFHLCGLILL